MAWASAIVSLFWVTGIGATSSLMAFVFAATLGIVCGVWPARRASALDRIDALRTEYTFPRGVPARSTEALAEKRCAFCWWKTIPNWQLSLIHI